MRKNQSCLASSSTTKSLRFKIASQTLVAGQQNFVGSFMGAVEHKIGSGHLTDMAATDVHTCIMCQHASTFVLKQSKANNLKLFGSTQVIDMAC